ncbi:unnamed protein product, partial [marine sediment metagenome]
SRKQYNIFKKNNISAGYLPFCVDENEFNFLDKSKKEICRILNIDYELIKDRLLIGSFQRDSLGMDLAKPKWQKNPDMLIEILRLTPYKEDLMLILAGPRRHYIINKCKKFKIHFKFPEYYSSLKIKFAKIILANSVKKAKKIIADSNSTAKDILLFFPEVRSKISVIYNGISENFSVIDKKEVENFKNKNGLGNYILFVGNRKPHKNLENLVKSYYKLIRLFRGLKLVIVGKKFSQNDIVDSIKNKFNLNNYIMEKENITDQELAYYYNGA